MVLLRFLYGLEDALRPLFFPQRTMIYIIKKIITGVSVRCFVGTLFEKIKSARNHIHLYFVNFSP